MGDWENVGGRPLDRTRPLPTLRKRDRLTRYPIPFLSLRGYDRRQDQAVRSAVRRVEKSGVYVLGPEVRAFEAEWAKFVGATHCVTVGSGLSALELGLKAMGVGAGDEVVVPEKTFVATWMAVTNVGAVPIAAKTEPGGFRLDIQSLGQSISPRTKVFLPVHLYGHPHEMSELALLAKKHNVQILEDAAQAHGASISGVPVGGHGNMTAWSFYPGKNLGALGDAGALTTDSSEAADVLRSLRNYGSREKYIHDLQGTNSRLDEIQAAVLRAKLTRLERANRIRREIAEHYISALETFASSDHIAAFRKIRELEEKETLRSAWHVFPLQTQRNREAFVDSLHSVGIETGSHYPRWPANQKIYRRDSSAGTLDESHSGIVSLPMGPHLTPKQVAQVVSALKTFGESLKVFGS